MGCGDAAAHRDDRKAGGQEGTESEDHMLPLTCAFTSGFSSGVLSFGPQHTHAHWHPVLGGWGRGRGSRRDKKGMK